MDQPLISVIVPVYKAEAYLERCVRSILNQTYHNLEIILVDDGSPDRCGEMCDAFLQEDSRIRVFHKKNGGQSSARNMGLDRMHGEYVAFVDSDGWIENEMYEHLYWLIVTHNSQIACCGIQNDFPDGRKTYYYPAYPKDTTIRVYEKMDALREILSNTRITYSPCDKLYHKRIFDHLRMTEGRIYEDMEILPKCVEQAERVVYDPRPLYHYIMTPESTIRGVFNPRRFAEAEVALEKAKDYCTRHPQLYPIAMGCYISICLNLIHLSAGVESCTTQRKELISEMRGKLPAEAVQSMRKQDKIKLLALRIGPMGYELLMQIYDLIKK